MTTYFNPRQKEETVYIFVQNLLYGKISLEYEKFGTKEEGLKYVNKIYEKIKALDNEALCPTDEPRYTDRIIDSIYDAILKGRVYNAIKGELHNETYEDTIKRLDEENAGLKGKNSELKDENIKLANELHGRAIAFK
jgi:hypothetical protein